MLHDRLTPHQSGNRSLHSTETLSLLVTDDIFRAMDSGQITAMVLLDLSKAFNSLYHSKLLSKLKLLGTSEKTQELSFRQAAVYSNWNIPVRFPHCNSRGTSGFYFRPAAFHTVPEWPPHGDQV